ncbi:MAG TPA: S8 family serine peptidase [Flavobacteriales bacterium]|nr:S8 family serine peptidase [Flavobacteriales bacterium]
MLPHLKKALSLFVMATVAIIARPQAPIVPGDILVMLRPGASADKVAADLGAWNGISTGVRVSEEVSAPMRAWLFKFDTAAVPQEAMLRAFWANPGVQLAQNNHIIAERNTPNDQQFSQQWWHQNIQSELAWDITTGGVTATGDTIVVAIIEKADLLHPDLAANRWINRSEVPLNGMDDDGNGYVDDVRGWNPQSMSDDVYGGGHGTQIAGMIGAVGNNGSQVAGANWHVKMMPVHYSSTAEANVLASYTYPLVMRRLYNSTGGSKGAFVVATNASWGVDGGQPSSAPLWCAMYDTLGAAGVLNCGSTTNNNVNVDQVGDLPTACPSDFMISVTATNNNDMRTFSGWGATTVDVGAPGQNVLTTTIGGGTGTTSGTSFASPLTAGVIALMYSVPCASLAVLAHNDPQEAALRVRQALFNGVDQAGNLPGNTVTGGRINAYNSVQLLMDSCETCPAPYNMAAAGNAIGSATISWSAMPGTYTLRYRLQGDPAWTTVPGLTTTSYSLSGLGTCQPYEFQLAADCGEGTGGFSSTFTWTSEGCCTAPLSVSATAIDTVSASIAWASVLASESYSLRWREAGATEWTYLQQELTGTSVVLTGLVPCSDIEVQMGSICELTDSEWSASTLLHIPGCGQCVEDEFCTARGDNTSYEWIALVKVNDINRASGSDGGYAGTAITEQSTELTIGAEYPIQLAPGYSMFAYQEYFTMWLDLDRDGQFTPGEKLYQGTTNSAAPLLGSITIPAGTDAGSARLRVVMKDASYPANGCLTYTYGETEDYCVNLVTHWTGMAEPLPYTAAQLYPQPADQLLHIAMEAQGGQNLVITDMTGRTVLEQAVQNGQAEVVTAEMGAGMYLYRVQRDGALVARGSFVVVH